ncbi:MAG: sulfatase family protein [Anaerolineae bacterium]
MNQTDEQRCDSLGCYGGKPVLTPAIDALAARGTAFHNHHVQSPVCVPSRMCELASRYPHQTGILNNTVHYTWGRWPEGVVSFPELFAQAGYVTCNLGKFHTPEHHTWLQNWHFEGFPHEAGHTYLGPGFDETEHEVLRIDAARRSVILSGRYPSIQGGRTPQSYLVDHAIDWLRQYQHVRRPFLLRVSFLAPHTPVLAPEPFYSMYDPADMNWDVPSETVLRSRPSYEMTEATLAQYHLHNDAAYRRMRTTYYGLVSHVDAEVGRLLDEVERLHLIDDTLIVYSSDHGNLIGEYGQFQKGMFYDLTTRVPLIVAGPGISQGITQHGLTEQVDLAPTLLRLAGLPVPREMVGRDLIMQSEPHQDVIGEIALERRVQSGRQKGNREVSWLMPTREDGFERRSWIRTERWSLDYTSELGGAATQTAEERDGKLIDYQTDPLAHNNLYNDPAYADVVKELQERFEQRTCEGRRPVQIGEPPKQG